MMTHLQITNFYRLQQVVLNRPAALNALDYDMIRGLDEICHQANDQILLVSGAGGRAFCAGGDIKAAYAGGVAARNGTATIDPVVDYFRHEYHMNGVLAQMTRPTIALMNGITMGGGVGVAAPCHYRIGCEITRWAMPETGIGFFPDVGAMYYLRQCPELIGLYLAMMGHVIDSPAAMLKWGLITHYVPIEQHANLIKALGHATDNDVANILADFHAPPPGSSDEIGDDLLACFEADDPNLILENLRQKHPEQAAILTGRSPHSVETAFTYYRWAKGRDLAAVLSQDLRLAGVFLHNPDFYEGVRAQVIDKDRSPKWQDSSLEAVDQKQIAGYF